MSEPEDDGIVSIPISKAGNRTIQVDANSLPADMFKLVVIEGLKAVLNSRMSKITGLKTLEGQALADQQDAAFKIAEENLKTLIEGNVKKRGVAAKSKLPAAVMTEARRLAKEVVKNEIRKAGHKISHIPASVITDAANKLIADDASYIDMAKANIEARTAKTTIGEGDAAQAAALSLLDKLGVSESPELVKKAQAEKDKRKAEKAGTLSAKQAGKAAPHKGAKVPPAKGTIPVSHQPTAH